MNKKKFLQLIKLDDVIKQLKLKIGYDGVDYTGEIKFFVSEFLDNFGMYFVVDLKNKLLSYQIARFEEKISDAKVEVFNSDMDALVLIRDIIIHFYFYIFGKHYNIDETDIHINKHYM